MSDSYFDENADCVTLSGLINKVTQEYENNAVVTVDILTSADVVIHTQNMPYVAGSDGDYRAVISETVDLSTMARTNVTAEIAGEEPFKKTRRTKPRLRTFGGE